MRTEYRVIATMVFDNVTDRDTWYMAIRTALVNAKPSKPAYRQANITKDDYLIAETATETV